MSNIKNVCLFVVAVILSQSLIVEPYSTGAPSSVCGSMIPSHRQSVQTSSPPYNVSPNTTETFGGGRILVKIESITDQFRGFVIQARDSGNKSLGTFYTGNHKILNCGDGTNNAVTHSSAVDKNVVTLEWEAPNNFGGDVEFTATVVKEFVTYWTNIKSSKVSVQKRSVTDEGSKAGTKNNAVPPVSSSPSLQSSVKNLYEGCGSTKSCYGNSQKCVDKKNCQLMVTYTDVGDSKFEFELIGKKNRDSKYLAVGLSYDAAMGSDSVVICSNENGVISIYNSWNQGKTNILVANENEGLTIVETGEVDGNTYCKFHRDAVTKIKHVTFDLTNEKYHILIAEGPIDTNGRVQFHSSKYVSASPVALGETSNLKNRDTRLLRAIHGSLMIGAWVCAASCGILLARYFKQTWKGFKCCGIDQWFIFHRFFMILTWSLTIAGFVIIVLELKEFRPSKHSIIGIVSIGLCFIQPFMAALRPAPDGKNRGLFNWSHWLVGNAAQILGITAIFFGFDMFMRGDENWLKEFAWYVVMAFIAFHCLIHIILSITQCISDRKHNDVSDVFPLKEFAGSRAPLQPEQKDQDAPMGCFRKVILTIYLIFNWTVTTLLILIVVFRRETIEQQLEDWNIPAFWEHTK